MANPIASRSVAAHYAASAAPVSGDTVTEAWMRRSAWRNGCSKIDWSVLPSAQWPLPAQGTERPYCPVAAAAAAAARRRSGIAHQLVKIALLDAVLRDGGGGCDSDRRQYDFAESTHSI